MSRFIGKSGTEAKFDSTKLHTAKDKARLLHYLGKDEVDAGAIDANGDTPIHAYVRRRDKQKLECLMAFLINAKYEDINAKNQDGDTPLHLACKNGDVASAKALIVFDADINQFNNSNQTPYDIARETSPPLSDILSDIGARNSRDFMEEEEKVKIVLQEPRESVDGDGRHNKDPEGRFCDEYSPMEGDKIPSIPEDEGFKTPDPSIETMAITSYFSIPRTTSSEVDESTILKETPFLPKVEDDTPKVVPYSLEPWCQRHSPRSKSPVNDSPLPRSPQRRSPTNTSPLSRSRSPSPLSQFKDARSHSPSPLGSMEDEEEKRLKAMTKKYSQMMRNDIEEGLNRKDTVEEGLNREDTVEEGVEKEDIEEEGVKNGDKGVKNEHTEEDRVKMDSVEERAEVDTVKKEEKYERKITKKVNKNDLMKQQGFVDYTDGEFFNRLDAKTTEVVERALEDSLGDEGYAAWLQYREVQKYKRERDMLKMEEVDFNKDWVHVNEPQNNNSEDPSKNKPQDNNSERDPSKPPPHRTFDDANGAPSQVKPKPSQGLLKHRDSSKPIPRTKKVVLDLPLPRHKRPPLHGQDPECSIMKSMSRHNPNMSVTESILGRSVVPLRRKKKKMAGRGHRILCLDGGGVKGLIQIEILCTIEKLAGAPITDLFDWIVGTSTGGIVTLGMVYGKQTLQDLRKIYFEMKDKVFNSQSKFFTTACDTEALESLLKRFLGVEDTMDTMKKPKVMITAVNKSTTRLPLVLFNNCFSDEYSTQLVWKVARYTSAAPVFFKECDDYIDGGVVANNPCNHALSKIKTHLRKTKDDQKKSGVKLTVNTDIACLVSVGCGIFPAEPIGNTDIISAFHPTRWTKLPAKIKETVTMLTTALTKSEDDANMCRMFCEDMEIPFYRFSPKVGEMIGTAEKDDMKLCDSIICTKAMLHHNQSHLEDLVRHLGHKPAQHRRITE